jgi:hypothetical protein
MKNRHLTLLIFIILQIVAISISYSQITINSNCNANQYNATYQVSNSVGITVTVDPNTPVYRYNPLSDISVLIFRSNNHWMLADYGTGNSQFPFTIRYRTVATSTSNLVPCSTLWEGTSYSIGNGSTCTLAVTAGSCDTAFQPSTYAEILPNLIRLPNLPSNAAPANPKNGMMYYDTTTNTVKVYSNGTWKSLSFQ